MDYLKIILILIIAPIVVWIFFGERLKYYFRNTITPPESPLEEKKEIPLYIKDTYSNYLESVRLASMKSVYEYTDPGKTQKLNKEPVTDYHRLFYIKGKLAGYTEVHHSRSGEALKLYNLENHHWDKDSRDRDFMQSLVSRFKKNYHELEKDSSMLHKYRELTEPFIHYIPTVNFAAIEQKLNIKFPEELTYTLSTVGVSTNWLSHSFETENLEKFKVNLRFSDAFVYHMLEQVQTFTDFSPEEQAVLSKYNNDLEELLVGYYYYDLEYTSAAEFELRGINFLRHCLASYSNTDDEPVMQVVSFSGIGESNEYLILDTSRAGYFWTDLTYERNDLNGIENPVYKHFEYADLMDILKAEITERNHLIKLLTN